MPRGIGELALIHFLDLLDLSALVNKLRFQALEDLLYAIFLGAGIKSHQAFVTMFHNVSILFCSIVDIHGGCDSVLDHVFNGFGSAFDCGLDRLLF